MNELMVAQATGTMRSKAARPLAVTTPRPVISLLVSVPVLSSATMPAESSVSTAAKC